jgi:hypothetical protein
MRINSRKIWKILVSVSTAPKRCTQETPRCIDMNAALNHLFNFRKTNKGFSYTIFPAKKINVQKVLKL